MEHATFHVSRDTSLGGLVTLGDVGGALFIQPHLNEVRALGVGAVSVRTLLYT